MLQLVPSAITFSWGVCQYLCLGVLLSYVGFQENTTHEIGVPGAVWYVVAVIKKEKKK